ncbi:MAG: hypothetical protein FJ098_13790 [Deltaproteobacteria bacterium]|nr:hypothetical protein [Deltaproteobacteria bacterium]
MRRLMMILGPAVLALATGCAGDGGGGGTLDVGGEMRHGDVPAQEIGAYEERPEEFCKGQIRREQFAAYDWQCEAVLGLGKCVVIPENPDPENSTIFCALCGLKGEKMVCYFIQQD